MRKRTAKVKTPVAKVLVVKAPKPRGRPRKVSSSIAAPTLERKRCHITLRKHIYDAGCKLAEEHSRDLSHEIEFLITQAVAEERAR